MSLRQVILSTKARTSFGPGGIFTRGVTTHRNGLGSPVQTAKAVADPIIKTDEQEYLNGPNQVVPSDSYISSSRFGYVCLRESPTQQIEPVSIPGLLYRTTERLPNGDALASKRNGQWEMKTYSDYYDLSCTVAKAFIALGLERRMGVAIMGFNSEEWLLSEMGAVFAGGMSVGMYETNSVDMCKFIMTDSGANIAVVENEMQLAKLLCIRHELPDLKVIVQYSGEVPNVPGVISWSQLLSIGKEESDSCLQTRMSQIAINECCQLIYTSGTTGLPKGVMLSHDNLTFFAEMAVLQYGMEYGQERAISYLPLSHIAAKAAEVYAPLASGSSIHFAGNDALKGCLVDYTREIKPTYMLGVPRVYEKIQEKMVQIGRNNGKVKQVIGDWAKKTALNQSDEQNPDLSFKLADKLVYQNIKSALGLENCRTMLSGAAPIDRGTLQYFKSLNININDAYGMSETTGPTMTNSDDKYELGSLGANFSGYENCVKDPVTGKQLQDNQTGEICMRGRHVMMGYLDNEEKTTEVFDSEGWLHSGDLGYRNEQGFFFMNGREKDLLITSGGENVAPTPIEDNIKSSLPCISHAMVIGDRRKYLTCLLTLKCEVDPNTHQPQEQLAPAAVQWCHENGVEAQTVSQVINDKSLQSALQSGLDTANSFAASNVCKVKKLLVLPRDFSIPGGELGPSFKMVRHAVIEKYQQQIETLYQD